MLQRRVWKTLQRVALITPDLSPGSRIKQSCLPGRQYLADTLVIGTVFQTVTAARRPSHMVVQLIHKKNIR